MPLSEQLLMAYVIQSPNVELVEGWGRVAGQAEAGAERQGRVAVLWQGNQQLGSHVLTIVTIVVGSSMQSQKTTHTYILMNKALIE